jgi:cardiolipin synthase
MRILACPVLGYFIVKGEFEWATGLLVACGLSDWVSLEILRYTPG